MGTSISSTCVHLQFTRIAWDAPPSPAGGRWCPGVRGLALECPQLHPVLYVPHPRVYSHPSVERVWLWDALIGSRVLHWSNSAGRSVGCLIRISFSIGLYIICSVPVINCTVYSQYVAFGS